jgi:hypothetical protein
MHFATSTSAVWPRLTQSLSLQGAPARPSRRKRQPVSPERRRRRRGQRRAPSQTLSAARARRMNRQVYLRDREGVVERHARRTKGPAVARSPRSQLQRGATALGSEFDIHACKARDEADLDRKRTPAQYRPGHQADHWRTMLVSASPNSRPGGHKLRPHSQHSRTLRPSSRCTLPCWTGTYGQSTRWQQRWRIMREPRTIADHSSAIFDLGPQRQNAGPVRGCAGGRPGGSCRVGSNLCSTTCGQAT